MRYLRGGRRYYRPEDISLLKGVQAMLHVDGYSIKGVQKALREQGVRAIAERDGVAPEQATVNANPDIVPVDTDAVPQITSAERKELQAVLDSLLALRADLTGEASRKSA